MPKRFDEYRKDRVMAVVFRMGGGLVVLVVVLIVVGLAWQTVPLLEKPKLGPPERIDSATDIVAVGCDPRSVRTWHLDAGGVVTTGGESVDSARLIEDEPLRIAAADQEIHGLLSVLTANGVVRIGSMRAETVETRGDPRSGRFVWHSHAAPWIPEGERPWIGATVNGDRSGRLVAAVWGPHGLAAARWVPPSTRWEELPTRIVGSVHSAAIAEGGDRLAIVNRHGRVRVLRVPDMRDEAVEASITAAERVRFLIGGATLVVIGSDGEVSIGLRVPRVEVINRGADPLEIAGYRVPAGEGVVMADDGVSGRYASRADVEIVQMPSLWKVVRRLPRLGSRPTTIAPGHRDRTFATAGADGVVAVYHATSGRRLVAERWDTEPVVALALAPRGDGLLASSRREFRIADLRASNPAISLRTLLLPVWYEGYAAPANVWQTSGGSDAFEPKYSLWPLLFGTLKATIYAMLVSVPLALLAAIYVSQLAPRRLQTLIKPSVELMAAVPSVIVGFLGALWLAPRLEGSFLQTVLTVASLPLAVIGAFAMWRLLPVGFRQRIPAGGELALVAVAVGAMIAAAAVIAGPLETSLFGGDLVRYLYTEHGVRYDQRNALVVGIALGFAVIPVIFTIAEDACSSVPRSLVRAARSLGATRWQASIRMVVPAALPGLLAAVILGFGRAVGETMIVLMASGNTPILDGSPFNGMRTMSAAIAVEIPEAVVGGTHFRVLFLAGLLLFAVSFAVTTVADSVGRKLRRRYARF